MSLKSSRLVGSYVNRSIGVSMSFCNLVLSSKDNSGFIRSSTNRFLASSCNSLYASCFLLGYAFCSSISNVSRREASFLSNASLSIGVPNIPILRYIYRFTPSRSLVTSSTFSYINKLSYGLLKVIVSKGSAVSTGM